MGKFEGWLIRNSKFNRREVRPKEEFSRQAGLK